MAGDAAKRHNPGVHQVLFSNPVPAGAFHHYLYHEDVAGPVTILLENFGPRPVTVALFESDDNADADAWAAQNVRVAGSSVASVVVQPGGRVVAVLEVPAAKPTGYWRLTTTPDQDEANGRATFTYHNGRIEARMREAE